MGLVSSIANGFKILNFKYGQWRTGIFFSCFWLALFILILVFRILSAENLIERDIPVDLPFGASTSAYQIEGAWNESGKGESIWDYYFHNSKSQSPGNINGDIACDSYHRYKEDIRLAANLGLKMFRFSISWTRILPTGYTDNINQAGIDHYKNVVDEMLKYNITPVCTLYHWDLPQQLFADGIHWNSTKLVPYFVDFSRIVIKNLPGVGVWITINEPRQICHLGYGLGLHAPNINGDGTDEYLCAYTTMKAHAAVYRMYKEEFPNYTAKMSISPDCQWLQPYTNSTADKEAAQRQMQFECGLYYQPIFKGDWPDVVKERIDKRSKEANLPKSRLPQFTEEEIKFINGTHDYLGVNHYYTTFSEDTAEEEASVISYLADGKSKGRFDAAIPRGVYNVLEWFKQEYGKNDVIMTEIGLGIAEDDDSLSDTLRVDYYADFICNILDAMDDGVNVKGIMLWSLIDNVEWGFGSKVRFGLYNINFDDPDLIRNPKKSSVFMSDLLQRRKLECGKNRRDWIDVPLGVSMSNVENHV